jgi:hypothetical protein
MAGERAGSRGTHAGLGAWRSVGLEEHPHKSSAGSRKRLPHLDRRRYRKAAHRGETPRKATAGRSPGLTRAKRGMLPPLLQIGFFGAVPLSGKAHTDPLLSARSGCSFKWVIHEAIGFHEKVVGG